MQNDENTENQLFEIVRKIRAWDPETEYISVLMDLCNEFDDVKPFTGVSLDDYTDITDLGVAAEYKERVSAKSSYPVWACDFLGNCIVGEGAWCIESIESIENREEF